MSIVNAISERRIGTFNISIEAFEPANAETAALMMAGVLIFQCVWMRHWGAYVYSGYHPDFDAHPEPVDIDDLPQYTALVASDRAGDPPLRTWRRVSPPQS